MFGWTLFLDGRLGLSMAHTTALAQVKEAWDLGATLGVPMSQARVAAARGDHDTPPEEMTTKSEVIIKTKKAA